MAATKILGHDRFRPWGHTVDARDIEVICKALCGLSDKYPCGQFTASAKPGMAAEFLREHPEYRKHGFLPLTSSLVSDVDSLLASGQEVIAVIRTEPLGYDIYTKVWVG